MASASELAAWVDHPVHPVLGSSWFLVDDVDPDELLELWTRLADSAGSHWPVITDADLAWLDPPPDPDTIASTLRTADAFHAALSSAEQRRGHPVDAGPGPVLVKWMRQHAGRDAPLESLRAALSEPRPKIQPPSLAEQFDLSSIEPEKPQDDEPSCLDRDEDLRLLLVPAAQSWVVPAVANFGGFNASPDAAQHVARLRRWHDAFGARLMGMGHDWLELDVPRPPADAETALGLALEHNGYCDGDGQVEDPEDMAQDLMVSRWWFFWWD